MTEQRGPLDRLLDLAVAVPTCTFAAAKRAVPLAARAGTLGTAHLVGRVSEAVHDRLGTVSAVPVVTEPVPPLPTDPVDDDPPESISVEELPIEGYDDLAARQVVDRLGALERADLARIEVYEREHRNRSTVLGKISILTT